MQVVTYFVLKNSYLAICKAASENQIDFTKNAKYFWLIILLWSFPLHSQEQYLDQGWTSDRDRYIYYHLSQGSQIMPYEWFMSLEQASSKDLFIDDYLKRFGYLQSKKVKRRNPSGKLPIGFALDKDRYGYWVGMTCAACHTGEINYKGKKIRIDGAPANSDFFGLILGIKKAVNSTLNDPEKFDRFLKRIKNRNKKYKVTNRSLRKKLEQFSEEWSLFIDQSTPDTKWGPGRNDAFGMIFNRVASINLGIKENAEKPNAPVSYPHVWGASYHDFVQWNGSIPNKNSFEILGRNAGEVLGVFGKAKLRRTRLNYKTSIRKINLGKLESQVRGLYAPKWPSSIFGKIDQVKATRGHQLYDQYCLKCHAVLSRANQHKFTEIEMTPLSEVGTDREMAFQQCNRKVKTGRLEGSRILFAEPLRKEETAIKFLQHIVSGSILHLNFLDEFRNNNIQLISSNADYKYYIKRLDNISKASGGDCNAGNKLMQYKARPLEGIWATPPYLHNGSVKNLYELLLPAAERSTEFTLGGTEFDPVNVGFKGGGDFGSNFLFDTSVKGNSNKGHDTYGNDVFNHEDRMDLLEYLKAL